MDWLVIGGLDGGLVGVLRMHQWTRQLELLVHWSTHGLVGWIHGSSNQKSQLLEHQLDQNTDKPYQVLC